MKRILALFLSVMIIISYFSFVPSIEVHAEDVKYIFIGDSRFVGMASAQGVSPTTTKNNGGNGTQTITQSGDVYWCAEVGTTIGKWESKANEALKKGKKGSTIVIYGLGVNGLSNISKDVAYCEGLVDDGWTVYYCDLLPTTSSSSIKDADVVKANETIYKSKKYKVIKYHDSCDTKNCTDGIHYNNDGYKAWYSEIMKQASSGGSSSSGGGIGKGEVSDDDLASALSISKDTVEKMKGWVAVCQADGWNDNAIAGMLGNVGGESGYNPLSGESGGAGGGLFQFTPVTKFSDSDYNKNCKHKKGSVQGASICADGSCQVAYEIAHLDGAMKSSYDNGEWKKFNDYIDKGTAKNHTSSRYSNIKGDQVEKLTVTDVDSGDKYKKLTNYKDACAMFHIACERSAALNCPIYGASLSKVVYNGVTSGDMYVEGFSTKHVRMTYAEKILKWINGGSATDSDMSEDAKNAADQVAQSLAQNGYWSENQLSQYNKLMESTVSIDGSRDDFTSKELGALSDWEQNVAKMNEKGTLIYWVRVITMIMGIIFTIWMLLIYIAYWFDRLNNLIDFDLLPILTFNRLRLSDTEETCTFRASSLTKTETRTVNHRAILEICIVGIAFGALVISGYLYVAILTLVQKAFDLLGIG